MLLSNLDLLATAPGGVARLRELILTLAVQGKLVPQDPADEPASVLLQKIRVEKDRLIAEGKIKRDKPLAEIAEEEEPFELPAGWAWVRLPEIYYSISPSSNKLLSSAVVVEGRFPVVDQGQRPIAGYTNDQSLLIQIPGPVIVFGDHTKVIKHIDFDFVAGADGTKILRPVLQDEKFFAFQLRGFDLEDRGYARHFKVLNAQLYALPPLAEQSRIVTRVEELMRLCDALQAKGQLEAAQHAQLVSTLLDTLTDSATPEELADHWQRVAQHFDLLLDRPEAIDALEQTLLQLAVRGLLVPQDPIDEPASELLKKIRAEKDRLIAAGQTKRDKPLPPITDAEKPFELPLGWEWVRVGNLGVTQTGGTPASNRPEFFDGDFPFIGPGQITLTGKILSPEKFISEGGRFESAVAEPGDIFMVCIGGSIGKSAAATYATAFNQQINSLHPLLALNDYLLSAMTAKDFVISVIGSSTGSATPIISKGKWDLLLLPMPPLAEQSRIVSRLAKIRMLCTDLRQSLKSSQSTQSCLVVALVSEVVAL